VRAVAIEDFGGTVRLKLVDLPTPEPVPDDVLVHVRSAGVGPWDTKTKEGLFGKRRFPHVLGVEASGIVETAHEHELLRQLDVKPGPVLGPPQAAPDAQRSQLRPRRCKGQEREDRRGLPAVAPKPGCGVLGRSGTRRRGSAPRTDHTARRKRRQARRPAANRACGYFEG
jgi:hypothetical protein